MRRPLATTTATASSTSLTRAAAARSTPTSTTPPTGGRQPRPRAAAPRRLGDRRHDDLRRRDDDHRRRQDRRAGGKTGTTAKPGKVGPKGLFGKQNKKGKGAKAIAKGERQKITEPALRNPDGSPTATNPSLTVAQFGPAPIGVPNFLIDSFEIPPFLLPIYQSCGTEYGIPWQVLAGINKIETAFGTNLNVSSAGAEGWMQFIPSTWAAYGVDANDDGRKDPYNPVDAICAAARYLRAAGGDQDLRQAIFAYNHADWYVDEVLLYANQYGKLPDALVGSLTGLTEGAHFPVAADARYADDINDAAALARSTTQRRASGNAADVIASNAQRRSINIYSSLNAPVVAVNDGVIKKMGDSKQLGKFIVLQDAYGNRYTYAHLGSIAKVHPVPRQDELSAKDFQLTNPEQGRRAERSRHPPATTPSAGLGAPRRRPRPRLRQRPRRTPRSSATASSPCPSAPATPAAPASPASSTSCSAARVPGYETFKSALAPSFQFDSKTMELKPLKIGSKVTGGTVIGRVGQPDAGPAAPQLRDPARRPRRPDDRPEADPRRLEAARDHRDLPGRRQEPLLRQPDRRPGPADVEGGARAAGARTTRRSRSMPAGATTSPPARSTAACWR